ncbi:MAG: urea ABC transporter ATP-binding protein UrtD [Fibrobacterota bacterium]|nr:urea ABC transporter ATP-binding protein UrtD [Fibrobacterota bacterium]QQS03144.1 MAG: urea ABC transporter ATP-binding protein UrtD [Fibrobacterota bacterium]
MAVRPGRTLHFRHAFPAQRGHGPGVRAAPSHGQVGSILVSVILVLDDITVSFDGFKALDNLYLAIDEGELRSIIGPNGAGKTTMMDVITGKTRPDKGKPLFRQEIDLSKLREAEIAQIGIGRKFQKPTVFEKLTVHENFELSMKGPRDLWHALRAKLSGDQRSRLEELVTLVGLSGQQNRIAGELSHGQKQWLEIGMLLAQEPQVLLLDEPVAGMTDAETEKTAELFLSLKGKHTLVVVEHDMDFIARLGGLVTVMADGKVLAEGTLDHVKSDERVIEVYLGR